MAFTYNGRLILLLAAFVITLVPGLALAQPTDLVAAFGFDEGGGATASDASGHAHVAAISGAQWTAGRFGGGLLFDGIDDIATVFDAPTLDLTTGMTIEAWIYPTSDKDAGDLGWGAVVLKETPIDLAYALYGVGRGGRPTAMIASPALVEVRASTDLVLNTWTHVATTFDGAILRVYVNGALVAARSRTGIIRASANPLRIGGSLTGRDYFPGRIDEVRIYRRALSEAEIRADMVTAVSPPDTVAPTVSLASPSPATVVADTVDVTAVANDDVRVVALQFFLDGAPLGPQQTASPYTVAWDTRTAANGTHVLSAEARDAAGNTTVAANVTVTVNNIVPDVSAPAVGMTGPADGATLSGLVTVTADASDEVGVSSVQFLLDGAPFGPEQTTSPYAVAWDTRTAADGTHLLSARARDAAGNSSVAAPVTVTVDNVVPDETAPLISLTAPATGASLTGPITVTADATDDVGVVAVQFLLDGAPFGAELTAGPFAAAWDTTTVADGTHVLSARARDAAGNSSVAAPVTVTVDNVQPDTTAPVVSVSVPAGGGDLTGSVLVTADATDEVGVVGVQFLLDGSPLGPEHTTSPYAVSWDTTSVANGTYVLSARARDAAGNSTMAASLTVSVANPTPDVTAPAISVTAPAGGAELTGSVTVTADASDEVGVVAVQFLLDGAPLGAEQPAPFTFAWDTKTVPNGTHVLSARARDAAGNNSVAASVTVTVNNVEPDVTAPVITLTAPAGGAEVTGSVMVTANATDEVGVVAVQFLLDGAPLGPEQTTSPYAVAWDTTAVADGTYGLSARARDAAGNSSVAAAVTVTVDNVKPDVTAPVISVTAPAGGAEVTGSVTVTADASDEVGVVAVQFLLDGAPLGPEQTASPYAVAWDTKTAGNTTHTLSATARDAAGNSTTAAAVAVTVANVPTLTITRPTAGATIDGAAVDVEYTTAGDLTGVHHVHFRLDDGSIVMDMSFDGVFRFTGVAPGTHVLNAHLVRSDHSKIDGTDAQPVSFTTVMPDVTPPVITLSAPNNGAELSGIVTVAADATDDQGIAAVQFLLDGADLGARDTTAPYAVSWETAAAADGTHTLSAVAYDTAGNATASEARTVSVANLDPAAQTGKWSTVMNWPLVAVHATLMHTGQVLLWDGWEAPALATVWNPVTNSFTSVPNQSGLFCSAHSMLADGRILVSGGHAGGEVGIVDVNSFDPSSRAWKTDANMRSARWYPSSTTLGDGRVLVLSGQITPGVWADTPELYDPATGAWTTLSQINTSDVHDPEYLLTTLLPDGRIAAIAASTAQVRVLDLAKSTWTDIGTNPRLLRTSAAMFRPGQILATGGGEIAGGNAEPRASVIDFNEPNPAWREIAPMAYPRFNHNMVVLPDGNVLAVGGSTIVSQTATTGTLAAELWNPVTGSWQTLASMRDPRMYHSTALLLPDGRVLAAGGGRLGGARDYFTAEIFSPPYLFKGTRPAILSAPGVLPIGGSATVQTAQAADIASVSLVRLASVTHTLDMEQRYLPLEFTAGADRLTIAAPASSDLAPPGYYMLFIVNSRGVPSTAAILRVPSPQEDVQVPSAPQNLAAAGGVSTAVLGWDAAVDDSGVVAYNVHRATAPGFTPTLQNRVGRVSAPGFTDFVATGTYAYVVTAEDAAGNVSEPSNEAIVTVSADITPPTVILSQPSPGSTVSGEVTIVAEAFDDVAVASVQFFVNGLTIGSETPVDTQPPYTATWQTRISGNGTYTLTALARDANGNETTSAPVTVTVANVTPAGLVAAFGFEEGTGTSVADSSGRGNNGTVSGAAWVQGRFGSALSFDGVNDMVTVLDSASLDLSTGMTLEAWVNPRALNGYVTLLMKERPGHLAYALYASTDTGRASGEIATIGNFDTRSLSPLPLNTWTHIAVTYNGTALTLYVNGGAVSTRAVTGTILQSANPLRIGGNLIWGEYFNGIIDEVRIYNRALTAVEIQGDTRVSVQP